MRRTIVALVALAAVLVPLGGQAEGREWEEDYEEGPGAPPSDYDVSVDLGVSGGVTFDSFQGALSPYGDWVVVGSYGRVWRPRVAVGWRPYYYGRWEWTNEGWMWVSDEPWGWAAYHYGRWAHDPYFGWVWVPGYEWAPAWVSWRVSGDVIGWAPLAPGLSVYVSAYPFVDFWWTFVPSARFVSVPVYSVAYAPTYARRHFHATAPAPARPAPRFAPGRPVPAPSPAPAWGGPAPRLIAERTGRPVIASRIVPSPAPGGRGRAGEIPVFRPESRPSGRALPGRGPGSVTAPGVVGAPGRWAPRQGDERGRPAMAPDRAAPERRAPPPASGGRPSQGPASHIGRPQQAVPPVGPSGRGPAPGWSGERGRGGERALSPAWRGESRGGPAPAHPGGGRGGEGRGRRD